MPTPRRLRTVTPVIAALLGVVPLPAAGPGPAWQWPLQPTPAVLAGFDPSAGRFGPGHRGVDLAAAVGAPVRSAGAGVVAFAGMVAGRPVVSVQHPDGRRTTYEPVVPAVAAGAAVHAGDLLGQVAGTPGHCGPAACLHWGLRLGETYLDPLTLVGAGPVRLLPVWTSTGGPAMPLVPVPLVTAAGPETVPLDRGPLLVADRLGRLTARRAGGRRAGGSRRARCTPGRRHGGSRGPPRS